MSADDYTNFPPGTHVLDNRMSLMSSPRRKSNTVVESKGSDKQDIILKPTPSDDPDDPLVRQNLNSISTIIH